MKRQTRLSFIIALAVLVLIYAGYLAETALTGGQLACDINGLSGCNAVAQSVYTQLFGIPLGVYGLVFYGFLLLAIGACIRPSPKVNYFLAVLAGARGISSLYFLYAQIFLIKALCIYCIGLAVIAGLLVVLTGLLVRNSGAKSAPKAASLPPTV